MFREGKVGAPSPPSAAEHTTDNEQWHEHVSIGKNVVIDNTGERPIGGDRGSTSPLSRLIRAFLYGKSEPYVKY